MNSYSQKRKDISPWQLARRIILWLSDGFIDSAYSDYRLLKYKIGEIDAKRLLILAGEMKKFHFNSYSF